MLIGEEGREEEERNGGEARCDLISIYQPGLERKKIEFMS